MLPAVWSEVRWAFTPPRSWLLGVAANVVLALLWLAVEPLTSGGRHHQDWVILVGTYFSSFVLADTTTTNVLGAEHDRVQRSLDAATAPWRILLQKNLALLILVGLRVSNGISQLGQSVEHVLVAVDDPYRLAAPLDGHHLTRLELADID